MNALELLHAPKVHEVRSLGWHNDQAAKELLQAAAKQVQPLMQKRGWVVPLLSEFYPPNPNLLGLNIGGGAGRTQEIRVRVRAASNKQQLFHPEAVLGTMLHELVHNVRGPHDATFYRLLDELTAECEALMAKGISGTGTGFDGPSQGRLGAHSFIPTHNPPPHKLRSLAAQAAEARAKRARTMPSGANRLGSAGGADPDAWRHLTPAQAAAAAAQRRAADDVWCPCGAAAPALPAAAPAAPAAAATAGARSSQAGVSHASRQQGLAQAASGPGSAAPAAPAAAPAVVAAGDAKAAGQADHSNSQQQQQQQGQRKRAAPMPAAPVVIDLTLGDEDDADDAGRAAAVAAPAVRSAQPCQPAAQQQGMQAAASGLTTLQAAAAGAAAAGHALPASGQLGPPAASAAVPGQDHNDTHRVEAADAPHVAWQGPGPWSCHTCTFYNTAVHGLVCEVCLTPRPR